MNRKTVWHVHLHQQSTFWFWCIFVLLVLFHYLARVSKILYIPRKCIWRIIGQQKMDHQYMGADVEFEGVCPILFKLTNCLFEEVREAFGHGDLYGLEGFWVSSHTFKHISVKTIIFLCCLNSQLCLIGSDVQLPATRGEERQEKRAGGHAVLGYM